MGDLGQIEIFHLDELALEVKLIHYRMSFSGQIRHIELDRRGIDRHESTGRQRFFVNRFVRSRGANMALEGFQANSRPGGRGS
ncbi:hypothetical protein ACU4GD_40150 [Cupriavidus basilensis]